MISSSDDGNPKKNSEVYYGARDTVSMAQWIINKSSNLGKDFPLYVEPLSHVVKLSKVNFDEVAFDPANTVLVMFHAPWCVHCETFRRNYERIATIFKDEENVVIAAVDADEDKDLSNRFDVNHHIIQKLAFSLFCIIFLTITMYITKTARPSFVFQIQ
jgi:hypothetical protein